MEHYLMSNLSLLQYSNGFGTKVVLHFQLDTFGVRSRIAPSTCQVFISFVRGEWNRC